VAWVFADLVWSGRSLVLVDHATEDSPSSNRCVDGDDHAWVVVGRMLIKSLMWPVVVEMAFVLADYGTACRSSYTSTRSVHSARTLRADRSA
jgi:hypothetical protein